MATRPIETAGWNRYRSHGGGAPGATLRLQIRVLMRVAVALLVALFAARADAASPVPPPDPLTVCGMPVPVPASDPPAGSGPVVLAMVLCFDRAGRRVAVEPATYLHYIQLKPSEPSRDHWVPSSTRPRSALLLEDFQRLWATSFLDDLVDRDRGLSASPTAPSARSSSFISKSGSASRSSTTKALPQVVASRHRRPAEGARHRPSARRVPRCRRALQRARPRRPRAVRREGLSVRRGLADRSASCRAGRSWRSVIFSDLRGSAGGDPRRRVHRQPAVQRRRAGAARSRRTARRPAVAGHAARGTFNEREVRRRRRARSTTLYRNHGYIDGAGRQPTLRVLDDSPRRHDALGAAARRRRPKAQRFASATCTFDGNTVVASEALRPLFQAEDRRRLQPGARSARDSSGRARSTAPAATSSSRPIPT